MHYSVEISAATKLARTDFKRALSETMGRCLAASFSTCAPKPGTSAVRKPETGDLHLLTKARTVDFCRFRGCAFPDSVLRTEITVEGTFFGGNPVRAIFKLQSIDGRGENGNLGTINLKFFSIL